MNPTSNTNRHGFTIIEMMLVVALIVIVATISVPVIQGTLEDARINAPAMSCAARWRKRGPAPWRAACHGGLASSPTPASISSRRMIPASGTIRPRTSTKRRTWFRESLPQDIIFGLTREDIKNSDQAGPGGSSWQTAAVFAADGSALDDTVTYFGKPGINPMRAKLRGLTGIVSIETYVPEGQ